MLKPRFFTPINKTLSINKGLVCAFPINISVGGYVYDHVNYHRTGKLVNNVALKQGNYGPVLSFQDGNQFDYVMYNDIGFPTGSDPLTVVQWVNTTGINNAFSMTYGLSSSFCNFYMGQYDLGAGRHFMAGLNGAEPNIDSNIAINDGIWHQLAVTTQNSGISLYLDGKYINTAYFSKNKTTTLTGSGFISSYDNQNWFGKIDQTLVYNRILSAEEINKLYYNPWLPYGRLLDNKILYQYSPISVNSERIILGNFPFSVGSPIYNFNFPAVR